MTETLFPVGPKLTDRQVLVHDLAAQPIDAQRAGAVLHEFKGCSYCKPDQPCQYAEQAGREVLEALRKKGLLRRDRHHVYVRTDVSVSNGPAADTGECETAYDPSTAEIPF